MIGRTNGSSGKSGGLPYIEVFPDSFYPPNSDLCQVVVSGGSNDGKILFSIATYVYGEDGNLSFSSRIDGYLYYMSWSGYQVTLNSQDGFSAILYIDSGEVHIESGTSSVPSLALRYYVES